MESFLKKVADAIKTNQDTIVKAAAGVLGAVVGYLVTGLIIDSQNPELIEELEEDLGDEPLEEDEE